MFIDVKKAHLYARCEEEEWIQLPEEFWEYGKYAGLRRWLCGVRKAAAGWEEEYAGKLESEGFRRGKGAPTVFFNAKTAVRLVVHSDDFTYSGTKKELEKIKEKMREWYVIKDPGTMCSGKNEIKEVTILGRTVRWTAEGLEYEADVRHRRRIMEAEGLEEDSKAAPSPAVKEDTGKGELDEKDLDTDDHRRFRSAGATLNYLGRRMKRVARYLVGAKRLVWKYQEMEDDDEEVKVDVYVDSDWASGWSRKSTSGGMLTVSGVGVKHWSRTQKARALSSGEAEYYAMVTGCAEGLGMQSLAERRRSGCGPTSAAKAIGNRRGLGKLRHVELKWLWVQDIVKEGRVKLKTVKGNENAADHLTKPKSKVEVEELLRKVGAEFVEKFDGSRCWASRRRGTCTSPNRLRVR